MGEWSNSDMVKFGFTVAITVSGVILWIVKTYETKKDANHKHSEVGNKLKSTDLHIEHLYKTQTQIAVDVSYIRGRMEPKD